MLQSSPSAAKSAKRRKLTGGNSNISSNKQQLSRGAAKKSAATVAAPVAAAALEDEDEPDVAKIVVPRDNHTSCVNDQIDSLREVFDEKSCLELLTEYYAILKEVTLPPETRCAMSGCEFDYSSNTYRLMVTLTAGTASVGENFLIVKIDGATGFPKVLSMSFNEVEWRSLCPHKWKSEPSPQCMPPWSELEPKEHAS